MRTSLRLCHICWVVQEIESGIVSDLVTHDPTFDPDPPQQAECVAAQAAHDAVKEAHERLERARTKLKALEGAMLLRKGFNRTRTRASVPTIAILTASQLLRGRVRTSRTTVRYESRPLPEEPGGLRGK